jgi:hypothetical protein
VRDPETARLTLNDEPIGLTDDRTEIGAGFSLGGKGFCFGSEYLCGNRCASPNPVREGDCGACCSTVRRWSVPAAF